MPIKETALSEILLAVRVDCYNNSDGSQPENSFTFWYLKWKNVKDRKGIYYYLEAAVCVRVCEREYVCTFATGNGDQLLEGRHLNSALLLTVWPLHLEESLVFKAVKWALPQDVPAPATWGVCMLDLINVWLKLGTLKYLPWDVSVSLLAEMLRNMRLLLTQRNQLEASHFQGNLKQFRLCSHAKKLLS